MSIEFNCPYCTAAIRVPDTASGKRGTCPKCGTKLQVPVVEIPDNQPAATATGLQHANVAADQDGESPPIIDPSESTLPPEISGDIPRISTSAPRTRTNKRSRKIRRGKNRGRKRNAGFLIVGSLVAVALLVSVLLFVLYEPPAKLEGNLTGSRITSVNIAPGVLVANDVNASAVQFAQAVQALQNEPLVLISELVRTEIRGKNNTIEVDISMTSSADFVAVQLTDSVLQQYVSSNALVFGKQRLSQLRKSATQLVIELSRDGNRRLTNPAGLRNTVALNLLRDGFGFVVDGAAGKRLCPCVYESANQIWFAVPAGTTSFEIRGRTIAELGQQFPGRYQVAVQAQPETVVIETAEDMPKEETPDNIQPPTDQMDSENSAPKME